MSDKKRDSIVRLRSLENGEYDEREMDREGKCTGVRVGKVGRADLGQATSTALYLPCSCSYS